MEINKLSVNEKLVLDELEQRSSEKPLTRREIRELTKLSDANNRIVIGTLRDKGYRVISGSSAKGNKGYWIAKTDKEYADWVKGYKCHAVRIFKRISAMDNRVEGQVSM